jgi:VWFA-related protein
VKARATLGIALLAIFGALVAGAGGSGADREIQNPLQHDVTVVNIAVPTRVYDGDKFVDNLTAADFEVWENGVPQKVEAAYLIRKTSVLQNAIVTGSTAPVAVPVAQPDESLKRRNFVLIFEMDDYLPQLGNALDMFCSEVLAPGDTLRIVTPENTYVLNRKSLDKAARAKLADEIKGTVRKSVTQSGAQLKSLLADLRILARSDGEDLDLKLLSARGYIQQIVSLKTMNVAQYQQFAKYIKPLEGQKFAFIFYQKESFVIPSMFQEIYRGESGFRMDTIDVGDIRRIFSDANTTAHFIYLTRANNSTRDVEWRDTDNPVPVEMSGDFFQSFRYLADATGGISEATANPIYGFKKAAEASENYYVVYYRPAEYNADGKYKEITVKVKGGRYRVTHRAGYIEAVAPLAPQAPPPEVEVSAKAPVLKVVIDLDGLLKKTADYCARLQSAALDFVCRESIEEAQAIPQVWQPSGSGGFMTPRVEFRNQKKTWLYDYQMVQKGGAIEEKRALLRADGKDKREDNATLKDMRFWHKHVILGPIGLFGKDAQARQAYSVTGLEAIAGVEAVVVEVKPRGEAGAAGLYGKAWVRASDGAILKIEWQPESMGDYEGIVGFAKSAGADVRLTFASEYGLGKGGIRFPTTYRVTEAYVLAPMSLLATTIGRRLITRSTTTVSYADYKYFTVDTDVKIR